MHPTLSRTSFVFCRWLCLPPSFTGVVLFIENAPAFTQAQASRMTGGTPTPRGGIAKDRIIVNKVVGQSSVAIKLVLPRPTVVANQFVYATSGEPTGIARSVRAVDRVQAFVDVVKESIEYTVL